MSYLNFINSQNEDVVQQTWDYMTLFTNSPDAPEVKGQLKVLENTILKSIRYVEKDNPYDSQLQKDALHYLKGNLAIVQQDYATLLKNERAKEVVVDRYRIFKEIRNKMLQIRNEYDKAIQSYGSRHDLKIIANTSDIAIKMQKTIKLYDHYYDVRTLLEKLKDADSEIWQDLPEVSPAAFIQRIRHYESVVETNYAELAKLSSFNNDDLLVASLKYIQDDLTMAIRTYSPTIDAILVAYTSDNRSNLSAKTDAYNTAKTALNIVRKKAYTDFNTASTTYLQKHLNSF